MLITVFVGIFSFLMVCCGIIFLLCLLMLGLALFDYLCDTDIKGKLAKDLGPRKRLKKIRKNVSDFMYMNDTPSKEDLVTASDEDYKRYLYKKHLYAGKEVPLENTFELEVINKEDFDQEVHEEINKIFDNVDEKR